MTTYILANKRECGFYFPERTQGDFLKMESQSLTPIVYPT